MSRVVYILLVLYVASLAGAATVHSAGTKYWPMPKNWHAPKWWLSAATCIHEHEGAWNDNTGNGYFGGMQFLISTWQSAGGGWYAAFSHPGDQSRYPFTASPREQLYRSWVVYTRDGNSFREWGTRGYCGV